MTPEKSASQHSNSDEKTLSRSNLDDVAHVNRQRERFARLRDETAAQGNETERNLCAQLMLLTTVLLTANLAIVGATDLTTQLTFAQRLLVVLSFGSLLFSIASGIKFYFDVLQSFLDWGRAKHEVVLLFDKAYDMPEDALAKKVDELQDLPNDSPRDWIYLQIGSLSLTLLLYFLILLAILFDWTSLWLIGARG